MRNLNTRKDIIIAVLASIQIISLPALFSNDVTTAINAGATILSALTSVGLLVIGFVLYDNFISKEITSNKVKTVIALIENLKKLQFGITYTVDNEIVMYLPQLSVNLDADAALALDPFEAGKEEYTAAFQIKNFTEHFSILNACVNSIYFPVELKSAMAFLSFTTMSQITASAGNSFAKIYILGSTERYDESETWFIFEPGRINAHAFYSSLQRILGILKEWLENKSSRPLDLNL